MKLKKLTNKCINGMWTNIYETPTGIVVAKTKHGYHPITRDGQMIRKRRFYGIINGCEVWEYHGKQKRSLNLKGIADEAC